MTSHNEDKGHWHGDIHDGKMHFDLPDATSTSHNEAQKTKADWLRSEIEKLEGMKNENQSYIDSLTTGEMSYENPRFIESRGAIEALTSIITRYKEELLELEKEV